MKPLSIIEMSPLLRLIKEQIHFLRKFSISAGSIRDNKGSRVFRDIFAAGVLAGKWSVAKHSVVWRLQEECNCSHCRY